MTLGYVVEINLLNSRPKNDDPSEIVTEGIASLVVGSVYTAVEVILATTPDPAAIMTSLS